MHEEVAVPCKWEIGTSAHPNAILPPHPPHSLPLVFQTFLGALPARPLPISTAPFKHPSPGKIANDHRKQPVCHTMAGFFSKSDSNEKGAESPPPAEELAAGENSCDEGDEVKDDLHRGMKPRQLSAWLYARWCSGLADANKAFPGQT